MIKSICILSGGLDSTTLLYQLLNEGKKVKAISFDYGQRHSIELLKAVQTCQKLKVEHKVIELDFMKELCSNSALTGDIEVPDGHYEDKTMKATVVPNRNMIMASIAIGWAVNLDYDEIALGVHAGDHQIYPDCRPSFIQALKNIALVANYKSIAVYTPFLLCDKGDIVIRGIQLGVDYNLTQTCYKGKAKPCGTCGSCVERKEAFEKANVKDPLC